MSMIDEEITASNARKFEMSSSAWAHFSKQYTHQWYTEERSNKFDDRIPATCRCCDDREDGMILHILRCSSRTEVHKEDEHAFQ